MTHSVTYIIYELAESDCDETITLNEKQDVVFQIEIR